MKTNETRRRFLCGLAGAGALGALPAGTTLAQTAPPGTVDNDFVKKEKAGAMQWHSERPLTGSVPAHEHDFDVTPTNRMFVRNNLLTPQTDMNTHRLTIKGLVDKELSFGVLDLPKQFRSVQIQGMLECAGSGR